MLASAGASSALRQRSRRAEPRHRFVGGGPRALQRGTSARRRTRPPRSSTAADAHAQQVERRAGHLVQDLLRPGVVEAPVEVHGEGLQALQASRQSVAAFGEGALGVEQLRLVHGERREAADRAGQLDLLVAQLARLLVEQLDERQHAVADAQRHAELGQVTVLLEQLALPGAQARVVERRDEHGLARVDGQRARDEVVERVVPRRHSRRRRRRRRRSSPAGRACASRDRPCRRRRRACRARRGASGRPPRALRPCPCSGRSRGWSRAPARGRGAWCSARS